MSNNESSLILIKMPGGGLVAMTALCAFFYFDRSVHAIASELADGIERYVNAVGPDKLTHYTANSGFWKPWTPAILKKHLRHLRNFPADHEGMPINYDSGEMMGPFGLVLQSSDLKDTHEAKRNNLLRLDFSAEWVEANTVDFFCELFADMLTLMSPQSANAGWAFKRTAGTIMDAREGVQRLLPRYLGFDPCYSRVSNNMRDKVFTAHWLNFIDDRFVDKLGGPDEIAKALPGCAIKPAGRGLLLRSAKQPPVGDVNRGAADVGCMPDVARLLWPLRPDISSFGDPRFDANRWMARLDDLPSTPWDNSHAG